MSETGSQLIARRGGNTQAIFNTYLTSKKQGNSKNLIDLLVGSGLLAKGRYRSGAEDPAIQDLFRRADADPALKNQLLSHIGLGTPEQLTAFGQKTIGPASGTTPASRAAARTAQGLPATGVEVPVGYTQEQADQAYLAGKPLTQDKVSTDQVNALKQTGEEVPKYAQDAIASGNATPPSQPDQAQTQQNPQQQPQGQVPPPNATTGQNGASGGIQDATIGQNGQAPLQVGGKFGTQQFGKVGNDVFEIMSDGSRRKVTAAEFNQKLKAQGLNLDVLPQLDQNQNFSDQGSSGPAGSGPDGISGTADDPSSFLNDYKNLIKELGITDIKAEFESVQKQYKDLQTEKLNKQVEINHNPWLSEGIRVEELRKLDETYQGREDILTNQLKLYDSMYQEGLAQAKYLTSGLQEERNKLLDLALQREEAQAKLLESQDKLDAGIVGEYEFAVQQGYTGSFSQYQNEDANRKIRIGSSSVSPTSTSTGEKYASRLAQEISNIYSGRYGTSGSREKAIQLLQAEFPGTNVTGDIYNRIPDGYESKIGTSTVQKSNRLQELLNKAGGDGSNVDLLTPAEQAELSSLIF